MTTTPQPPTRRLTFKLELGADDIDSLYAALRAISTDLDIDGRETRDVTSGGYSDGYHYTLTCDPEQTGDQYREQLEAWRRQRIEAPK